MVKRDLKGKNKMWVFQANIGKNKILFTCNKSCRDDTEENRVSDEKRKLEMISQNAEKR